MLLKRDLKVWALRLIVLLGNLPRSDRLAIYKLAHKLDTETSTNQDD